MKKTVLHLLLLLIPVLGMAQRWELGLTAGAASYEGDVNRWNLFQPKEANLNYGLFLRYHASRQLTIRGNVMLGNLTGDDLNFKEPAYHQQRAVSFKSPLTEFAILGEWNFLDGTRKEERLSKSEESNLSAEERDSVLARRTKYFGHRYRFSPYLFAGLGFVKLDPTTDFSKNTLPIGPRIDADKNADPNHNRFTIPMGAGAKYHFSQRWTLGLEGGFRPTFYDYADGISKAGDTKHMDWYFSGNVHLGYRFGIQDRDDDGIADEKDVCPDVFGVKSADGCPDTDMDGVADKDDSCPEVKGLKNMQGCPDTDEDGVADKVDTCPTVKGLKKLNGCPDTDGDGIADGDDKCPTEAGLVSEAGCPLRDRDRDGIADRDDKCPDEAGVASEAGCPLRDTDKDGILDRDDKCPTEVGTLAEGGCPVRDRDGDGIADAADRCPDIKGTAAEFGCAASVSVQARLDELVRNINFETSRSAFLQESYNRLNEVVSLLQSNPQYNVRIEGHTDNTGREPFNQELSESRAKACYDYIRKRGIKASRLSHAGFGASRPVGDNNTEDGKRQNRRVEFTLYVP